MFIDTDQSFSRYSKDINKIPMISTEEENRIRAKIKLGDEAARKRLITGNLRFGVAVAKIYRGRGLPFSDLISEANRGLVCAAKNFDPNHKSKFISYAVWWMRAYIQRELARTNQLGRTPLTHLARVKALAAFRRQIGHEELREPRNVEIICNGPLTREHATSALVFSSPPLSLDRIFQVADTRIEGPTRKWQSQQLKQAIMKLLNKALNSREAEIISLSFGLNERFKRDTLKEIGLRLQITQERVRQIKAAALEKLKKRAYRPQINDIKFQLGEMFYES